MKSPRTVTNCRCLCSFREHKFIIYTSNFPVLFRFHFLVQVASLAYIITIRDSSCNATSLENNLAHQKPGTVNATNAVTMVGPSPHKPRRKVKKAGGGSEVSFASESSARSSRTTPSGHKPTYPLAAFLWPARSISQWEILPLILMAVGLFRWAAGLWGYSGRFSCRRGEGGDGHDEEQ